MSKSIKQTQGVKELLISHHCGVYIPDSKEFGSVAKSLFIFGGCYEEGELSNDIWTVNDFMNLRSTRLEIEKVKTRGIRPEKRYLFTMAVLGKSKEFVLNILLVESVAISGGLKEGGGFLDDLHVFVCLTKTWLKVQIPLGVLSRAGHSVINFILTFKDVLF